MSSCALRLEATPVDRVSRETQEPVDAIVWRLFPQRTKEIYRYVDLLASIGVERGLIGPVEGARLWERHILNCAVVSPVFARSSTVCDLGSGAGLPGVVLALARPDLSVTLLEPLLRRSTFLTEVLALLEVANVEVVRARAEQLVGKRSFDAVTARAVAPLGRLAGWGLPLCRPGGELVAIKGSTAADEARAAAGVLAKHCAGTVRIEQYGADVVSPATIVIRIESSGRQRARMKGRP